MDEEEENKTKESTLKNEGISTELFNGIRFKDGAQQKQSAQAGAKTGE